MTPPFQPAAFSFAPHTARRGRDWTPASASGITGSYHNHSFSTGRSLAGSKYAGDFRVNYADFARLFFRFPFSSSNLLSANRAEIREKWIAGD